jgi:hypothetical protein
MKEPRVVDLRSTIPFDTRTLQLMTATDFCCSLCLGELFFFLSVLMLSRLGKNLRRLLVDCGTCLVEARTNLEAFKTSRGNEQEDELRRMPEQNNHRQRPIEATFYWRNSGRSARQFLGQSNSNLQVMSDCLSAGISSST